MRFTATISVRDASELAAILPTLQRGQWVNMGGIKGRVVGQGQSLWMAWAAAASNPWLFRKMVAGFKRTLPAR